MISMLAANTAVTTEQELYFPNLFGGLTINYFRGFMLFGIPIYWYGVLITIGVVLGYLYASWRAKEFGVGKERMFDVVFVAIIAGFLGARIYYCVFQTLDPNGRDYDFITTFTTIRDGGLAIYGGIIGSLLAGFVMCKIRKVNFRAMFDIASMGFLVGQCIGRWGNFVNQEAHGSVCSPDWLFAMTGSMIMREPGMEPGAYVHPCFLYESVWCLLGLIAIHFYSKKLRTFDGEITLLYVSWYGLGRAFIEGLRTDSLMAGDIRISQLIAVVSFVAGVIMLIVFKIYTEKKKIPLYVNTDECRELAEADKAKAEAEKKKQEEKRAAKEAKNTAPSILADGADDEEEPSEESDEEKTSDSEASPDEENGGTDSDTDDNTDEKGGN